MNRGRAAKKDYNKILRDMPNDKIHTHYSKNLNQILDQRTGNSYTMAFFNDRTLSPKLNKTEHKKDHKEKDSNREDGVLKDKMFRDYERKMHGKQMQMSKRIKTMQRSIDLYDKKRDSSFEKFLKKEFRPVKQYKKESKSPYMKKLARQSLNIVPNKERNSSLYNSNKALKDGGGTMHVVFSHRGKISSKLSLKGTESSKLKKYNEDELLSKGRLAHQEGKLALSIEYFNQMLLLNPEHLEGNYLLAVAYMNRNQFVKALKHFDLIAQLKPDYSKNVYVLAAISCKKMLLYEQSQKRLTKCIELFPDNADAYLYRAKLRLREGQIVQAMKDFEHARIIEPNRSHSYIGRGDCYFELKEVERALECYENSLKYNPSIAVYLKIAECQYLLDRYNQGYVNISKLLAIEPKNQEALFVKAQCLVKLRKTNDANMIFELILRSNDSKFVSRTIEQMVKIKISERDFYSAQHILERQSYLQVDTKYLERIKQFTEAVIFMMKRKFHDGIEAIEVLAKRNKYFENGSAVDFTDEFLKPLVSLYIAYGYFSLGQFKSSMRHYQHYISIMEGSGKKEKIALSAKYNLELCQAMLALEKRKYSFACQKFEIASKIFPQKIQPFFFKALTLLQIMYEQEEENEIKLNEIITIISSGIDLIKDTTDNAAPHLYYFRSALYGTLSQWNQCLSDIDSAIERSQDNIPKFFYVRGSAFACCQSYKQAVHDLSICLSINSNYAEAFLLRSKCLQLEGETNEAFVDLQRYITLKPQDPLIHKYAGHLLFENGAFEDSILAYAHGEINIPRDLDIFSTRAKAYLLLGQFTDAAADLKTLCANSSDTQSQTDLETVEILLYLQKLSNSPDRSILQQALSRINRLIEANFQGKIFRLKEYCMIHGAVNAFLSNFEISVTSFEKCIKLRQTNLKQTTVENQVPDVEELEQFYIYCNHMKYNISLCHLANKNLNSAYEIAQQITVDKNKPQHVQLWNKVIKHQICGEIDSQSQHLFNNLQNFQVFSLKNKLSRHLQPITLSLRLKPSTPIKLCLSFPKVQPPEINPTFDRTILQGVDYNDIESKPQAPWIRKSNNYVMFTSTIQVFDNLDLLTESKTRRNEQQDEIEKDNSIIFQNEFYNDSVIAEKMNIEELKQQLKLEDKVQKKLKKILNK